MTSRAPVLAMACLSLALLGGCGGDGASDEPAGDTGSGTTSEEVGMKDIQYVPMEVTVKKGGTVTWTNSDTVTHTVTKEGGPGPQFDSGNMAVDETFEQTFDVAGTIDYVCTIHPNQTGTVTVE